MAIVGRSGCGKSPLLRVLAGLERPSTGSILYGDLSADTPSRTPALDNVDIGVVLQHAAVFPGTIRENITLGKSKVSDDDVMWACWESYMDDILEHLPAGLSTPIAEIGGTLSGGQMQRISIARAVVGRPNLLLMDEPTSCLDEWAERSFMARLPECNATKIVVTHRSTVAAYADVVLTLQEGRLVGQRESRLSASAKTFSHGRTRPLPS